MSVKYSAVIPVYNVAPYLRDCLDALLLQTYPGWEAICVDDGSTDESGKILDEYSKLEGRIKVIHQRNAGVSNARNVGLEMAQGDWVLFLDADDLVAPDLFEVLDRTISRAVNPDMIAFGVIQFEERERPNWARGGVGCITTFDCSNYYDERWASLFSVWGKAFRRATLTGLKFDSYKISEDYLFMVRYTIGINILLVVDTPCYGYRQRASSVMHSSITLDKVQDVMNANATVIRIMSLGGKCFSRRIRRLTARQLFDFTVVKASRLDNESKARVFNELKVYAREFCFCKAVPFETRVRLCVLRLLSFNDLALKCLFGVVAEMKYYLRIGAR